tara:strand:+ start:360 stop:1028 length:669 start_codon:yes stop_codon:yes gene_type:complete
MAKLAHALAAAAGNAASFELTYLASNTNTTSGNTLALPSGTQVGDLVISLTGTIGAQYTPPGWTTAFFFDSTFEINCLYKVMEASDISGGPVQLATVNNPDWTSMQFHTFRPSSAITSTYVGDSVAARSFAGTSITVNPNLSILGPPHIILGGNLFYNLGTPNMTGTFWDGKTNTLGFNNAIKMQFAYEIQPDYSTSRTFSQTGTGNSAYDLMGGCYLSLAP